jgi:outer membrane receptor protein involved in Fe transport
MRVSAKEAMRHLLLAAGLLSLGATTAWAQTGKITGVVTDAQTGEPIAGAQIYIEELERGVLTQENGRYFLINLPVGNYTVVAEIIGYATVRKENVVINVDVTRQVNFELPSAAVEIEEVVVEVQRTPLIDVEATGARDVVTAAEIEALPVTDLKEVLALQHGFIDLPDNTDVIAFTDARRGLEPVHIRGGRLGETTTLIDGIPVNNFVFGGPAFFVNRSAVQQLDYIRGGFDAEYGNALSGVINVATKEGGTQLRGAAEYQGSGLSGALGSNYDDLRDYHQAEGWVSGPVPGTDNRLRFMVAGRELARATRVLEFDNDVYNPLSFVTDVRGNFASLYDLLPGWRSLGFDNTRDLFGKLSFYFTPLAKLNFTFLDYRRQLQPYDFEWLQVGFDLVDQCKQLYPEWSDVCERTYLGGAYVTRMEDLRGSNQEQQYVLQSSINLERQLLVGKWDHNLGARARYTIAVGQFKQSRNTCAFLSGVCLQDHLAYVYSNGPFAYTGELRNYENSPIFGTDKIYGGEDLTTNVARADLEWQATDHHNVQAGVFYQHHDVSFLEGRNVGLNNVEISQSEYYAKPWDAAFYVQDKVEYDFITVSLGLRFDYGKASGLAFVDPRDPTNGTTALEVCNDPTAFGLPADQFTYTYEGQTYTGFNACSVENAVGDGELLGYAADVAFQDDYGEAPSRTQLSPRIGISFPVTASSSFMFNAGRYAQNPTLHNLYRGTGIGTDLEGTRTVQAFVTGAPGEVALLGNPRLPTEQTTLYEFGYVADLFDGRYGLSVILYNKDQSGLTGFRNGGYKPDGTPVYDPAATYGSIRPFYDVLLNLDYQTSRGLEFSLRRRLANYWGFDLRYSFAQVRTNAAPPDLEQQKQSEGDPPSREEIRSTIDLPHVLNAVVNFGVGRETPDIPLGSWLRFFNASAVVRISSGVPYTPQIDFGGSLRLERNSGTSPTNFTVDLRASKDWQLSNMRFGIFMNVFNLFNAKNCLQVFPSTGRCDSGAITQRRAFGTAAAENSLSTAWDRPDYVSNPRSFSFGARMSF